MYLELLGFAIDFEFGLFDPTDAKGLELILINPTTNEIIVT